ncbi:MAG: hypothetical protein H7A37_04970 [Chlamydiales bacterium]|nr:hypothetical protein [Chlamydiia bacterium]MCP5507634.1 hypothetical protein [Chlamydiales bacterium]
MKLIDRNSDLAWLKDKTIGFYLGSFDPLHLGHEHVINSALKRGVVDEILIYPAPGGDRFKKRSDVLMRQKMLEARYKAQEHILLTRCTPKELQKLLGGRKVIGIIGSDLVLQKLLSDDLDLRNEYDQLFMRGKDLPVKHEKDTIGAVMALRADQFIVATRENEDLSALNGKILDRNIIEVIPSFSVSSSEIRERIRANQPITHLVSPAIAEAISAEGLYVK